MANLVIHQQFIKLATIRHKLLTVENIDEFDEFPIFPLSKVSIS